MEPREIARHFRKQPTRAEARLWAWLRARRFGEFKFRRQHPIAGYILDFYCVELNLAIELDGSHHESAAIAEYDAVRASRLQRRGIDGVRIRNVDLDR